MANDLSEIRVGGGSHLTLKLPTGARGTGGCSVGIDPPLLNHRIRDCQFRSPGPVVVHSSANFGAAYYF